MQPNQLKTFSFWLLAILSLMGITLLAFVEIINMFLQHSNNPTVINQLYNELNPFNHASKVRILYMLLSFLPFVTLLLLKGKVWRWLTVSVIALLTTINSADAIEHLIAGDTIFAIVFLILVTGFGILACLSSIQWAKQDTNN